MSRLLPALAVLAACSSTAPKELHTTTHTGAASRDTSTDTAGACTEEKGVLSGTVSLDWTPPETSSVHVLVSDGGELPIELLVDSTHQWSVELAAGPWSVWAEVENRGWRSTGRLSCAGQQHAQNPRRRGTRGRSTGLRPATCIKVSDFVASVHRRRPPPLSPPSS